MEAPPEETFKTNLEDLTDLCFDLLTLCQSKGVSVVEPGMMKLAKGFLQSQQSTILIESYIRHSHIHWDSIKAHDERFFLENAGDIFKALPLSGSITDSFRLLFTLKDRAGQDIVTDEYRDSIWECFECLTRLSINYIHKGRGPGLKLEDGEQKRKYSKKFFTEVDIIKHCKTWGIDRVFK